MNSEGRGEEVRSTWEHLGVGLGLYIKYLALKSPATRLIGLSVSEPAGSQGAALGPLASKCPLSSLSRALCPSGALLPPTPRTLLGAQLALRQELEV